MAEVGAGPGPDLLHRWRIRSRFTPEACEFAVEIEVADAVPLRGYLDRLDLAPTGQLRVVDYKTGRSPGPGLRGPARSTS